MKNVKFKRVMTTIVILLLAFSITLTGCGKSTTTQTQSTNSTPTASPTKTAEPQKPVEISYLVQEHPNWPVSNDTLVLQEVLKRTNVKINFIPVPGTGWNEKINVVMASGELPDMMDISFGVVNQYASKGAFVAINDKIDSSAPNLKKVLTPKDKALITSADGKIYGVPLMGMAKLKSGIIIRQDWLDKLTLKQPTTTDEFETVLKAFKERDPDGNGKADTIPMLVQPSALYFIQYTLYPSFGLHPEDWTLTDGKFIANQTTAEYKEMLTWLNKLYTAGLLDKEFATISDKQWEERVTTEKGGATVAYSGRSDYFNNIVKKTNASFNMLQTPPLKGPKGKQGATAYNSTNNSYMHVITKNCKNPDAALKFVDFLYSDEGSLLTSLGKEGVTYQVVNGKKQWMGDLAKEPTNVGPFAKFGIRQQMFPRLMVKEEYDLTLEAGSLDAIKKNDGLWIDVLPPFTYQTAEQQRVTEIKAVLKPIFDQYAAKFIMGEEPLSNWDAYQALLKKSGIDELTKIQNDTYVRYQELLKTIK